MIIAGKHNGTGTVYFWRMSETTIGKDTVEVGDYAVVENKTDYDMVKVIGILDTKEKYVRFFGVPSGNVKRSVIMVIPRKYVRED